MGEDDLREVSKETGTGLSRKRTLIGVAATAAYLLAFAIYAVVCLHALLAMKPDEFGTFLSGVFAPLAFGWLVLGFFQQGEELRHSARALWLQGEELRNSVEQQRSLVDVSREQLAFERERIEGELQTAKRRAQPDFVFTGGGYSSAGESMLMNFRLLNRGARCTDVNLYVTDQQIVRRALMESGQDFEVNIEVRSDHILGDRPFKVEFVDLLGERGEQVLLLQAVASGTRTILRIPN